MSLKSKTYAVTFAERVYLVLTGVPETENEPERFGPLPTENYSAESAS